MYLDMIRFRGSGPPICVAVENTTNLTVVDTDMSTVLDKSFTTRKPDRSHTIALVCHPCCYEV